jgi:hypothetical protein
VERLVITRGEVNIHPPTCKVTLELDLNEVKILVLLISGQAGDDTAVSAFRAEATRQLRRETVRLGLEAHRIQRAVSPGSEDPF